MKRESGRRPARALLAALALACAAAPPAEGQEGQVARMVRNLTTGLRSFVAGPAPAEEQAPRGLRRCGSLYGPDEREIVRGPEYLNSYARWIERSEAVVRRLGGPLPVCFEPGADSVTSNQGWFLLQVNNHVLAREPAAGYVLEGYTDPQERDAALALRRAAWLRGASAERRCRFAPRRAVPRQSLELTPDLHRRVEYARDPAAASGCRRPPPR